ncbi:MAG: terpene cyclase/mutase family protein [Planctomycetes bacterium]|nr:terpene cyclase/mutase family protein [Planctomycetota bacterium]
MTARVLAPALLVLACLCGPARAAGEEDEPLELQVNRAIDLSVRKLLSEQAEDGSWGAWDKVHPLGRTALSLFALLHAGLPQSHAQVAKGIDYLLAGLAARRATLPGGAAAYRSTYETGIILMLLYSLGPKPRYVDEMEPLVEFLAQHFDEGQKLWAYPEGAPDLSNTQYAILGLKAASLRGVAPRKAKAVWAEALKGIVRCHKPDGGFAYQPARMSSSSMTVAGLALVKLCEEELKGFAAAGKDLKEARDAARAAEEWIARNFTVSANVDGLSRGASNLYYYLYGLERYAVFYGLKTIGGHDWYREGAEFLIRDQQDDGSWGSTEQTCFALLFLRKAALTMPAERSDLLGEARREDNPKFEKAATPPRPETPCAREWLVAGPFAGTPGQDDALLIDHISEADARGAANKKAGKKKWFAYLSDEDSVDLQKAGAGQDWTATYAFTWVVSPVEQEVLLWLDSDDGIRVFHEGQLVLDDHHHDGKSDMSVRLALPAGRSRLLLKVENIGYYCRFKARFAGPEGEELEGLATDISPR